MFAAGVVVQLRLTGQGSDHRQGNDRLEQTLQRVRESDRQTE